MFKFKIIFTDGTKKILKSNDIEKISNYVKENLLSISEVTQMKEKADDSINSLSEKDQISMVQHKPSNIKYIKDPSEAVQLAAIEYSRGDAMRYIKNPTEKAQLAAVKIYGRYIAYIKNPSEAVKLAAVKNTGDAIEYIENPSEAVQLAAVKQHGEAIRYIENPTEEMQLIALEGTREVLYQNNKDAKYFISEMYGYIKNPTEKAKQLYKTLIKERS